MITEKEIFNFVGDNDLVMIKKLHSCNVDLFIKNNCNESLLCSAINHEDKLDLIKFLIDVVGMPIDDTGNFGNLLDTAIYFEAPINTIKYLYGLGLRITIENTEMGITVKELYQRRLETGKLLF